MLTLYEEFKKRVRPSPGCWLWTGTKNRSRRGQLVYEGKWYGAPRLAYKFWKGEDPLDKYVLHTCDNPQCVNPNHLFLGDQTANMKDMVRKGRSVFRYGDASPNIKLTDAVVSQIKKRHVRGCPINGTAALAREFGVVLSTIQTIVNNRRRTKKAKDSRRGDGTPIKA